MKKIKLFTLYTFIYLQYNLSTFIQIYFFQYKKYSIYNIDKNDSKRGGKIFI